MSMKQPMGPFTILVVCTGNICRSPVAERLLQERLAASGISAVVQSVGVRALVGHDMTVESKTLLHGYKANSGGHAARQVTEQAISDADLVLTATREHRSAVVLLHPRAARYTYTLNQFSRLLPLADLSDLQPPIAMPTPLVEVIEVPRVDPAPILRTLVAEVAVTRGYSPPPSCADDDDIEDPYQQSSEVYLGVGRMIDLAVKVIVVGFAAALGRK